MIITLRQFCLSVLVACAAVGTSDCGSESRQAADSTRMVDGALRVFRDSIDRRARAAGLQYRFIRLVPDSLGACVWIEGIVPGKAQTLDGGPFGVPMARDGSVRIEAFK